MPPTTPAAPAARNKPLKAKSRMDTRRVWQLLELVIRGHQTENSALMETSLDEATAVVVVASVSELTAALTDEAIPHISLSSTGSPYHIGTLHLRRQVCLSADVTGGVPPVVLKGRVILAAHATLQGLQVRYERAGPQPTVHVTRTGNARLATRALLERCTVVGGAGAPALRLDDMARVSSCVIDGAGAPVGVLIAVGASSNVEGFTVEGCTVRGCVTGIELRGAPAMCQILSNEIFDCRGSGVLCSAGTLATLRGNNILRSGGAGIEVVGGDSRPRVVANTVHDGRGVGVLVHGGAAGDFEENDIRRNQSSGVELNGTAAALLLRSNQICDSRSGVGVLVHGGVGGGVGAGASSCVVGGGASCGGGAGGTSSSAELAISEILIASNDIRGHPISGIEIGGGAHARLDSNSIHHCGQVTWVPHAGHVTHRGVAKYALVANCTGWIADCGWIRPDPWQQDLR